MEDRELAGHLLSSILHPQLQQFSGMKSMRLFRTLLCLVALVPMLASCASGTLLSDVGPAALELQPTGHAQGTIRIVGVDAKPPLIDNLVIFPETISPNADGIDDIAEITYQLPVSATVDITFTGPDGQSIYQFVAADKEGPTVQRQIW